MAMSQQNLGVQVGVSVTKMALDLSEQNSQLMTDMLKNLEHSVTPHLGQKINIKL